MLGGMFDPVHFGHLRSAVELREVLGLAEVRLVPCAKPPHRPPGHVTAQQRAHMLQLAVDGEPGLRVDERELQRDTPSYSVDTLLSLRAELPDTPLCLVVGRDAFCGLPSWHRWTELFALAHIVVLDRPGHATPIPAPLAEAIGDRRSVAPQDLHGSLSGRVFFQPVTQLEISSTALRAAIAAGRSVRYLVPDPVYRFIQEHRLYA